MKNSASAADPRQTAAEIASDERTLRHYVFGDALKSLVAFASLKSICETHLAGRYRIEVIDLSLTPHLAQTDQIIALPTLVRKLPKPTKRIIDALSNLQRVLVGVELQPATFS